MIGGTLPGVAVCILNWNGWSDTLECLESVRKQDYPNYLSVVVDNHSLNDSAERIRSWAKTTLPEASGFADYTGSVGRGGGETDREQALQTTPSPDRLVLICNEENTGFTGGCNLSFEYVLKRKYPLEYLFLLNNDATIEPDCLTRLLEVAKASGAGIIGAVMLSDSGEDPIFNGRISMTRQFFHPITNWHQPPPATRQDYWPSDCAHGGAMLIRSDVLRAVHSKTGHYLRDGLFMYNECAEFQYYAAQSGYRAVIARRAVVYHKNARSSGGTENPIAYYYTERSRIQVANVVLPWGWKAPFHVVNAFLALTRILKNALRGRRVVVVAILEGIADGYRGRQGKWRWHDERVPKESVPK